MEDVRIVLSGLWAMSLHSLGISPEPVNRSRHSDTKFFNYQRTVFCFITIDMVCMEVWMSSIKQPRYWS
jgi:hypothetical protein